MIRDVCQGVDGAWEQLVQKSAPVVVHAVEQLSRDLGYDCPEELCHSICCDVFSELADRNFAALRELDRNQSLNTFLIVVTYRQFTSRMIEQNGE